MYTRSLTFLFLFVSSNLIAQVNDSIANLNNTFRNTLYTTQYGLGQIGGYAQIDYNQPFGDSIRQNGELDAHRIILFVGHRFSEKLSFFTEIEVEHAKEIFIEQAFLEYKLTNWMNLRAGVILIPMGIVNEYHEPPTFNGVERPALDRFIVPSTWREVGAGLSGNVIGGSFTYQAYIINGPISYYNGDARFRGLDGMRKGRQKAAESVISNNPNFAAKVSYYGFSGLSLSLSGYAGKSESTLYNGVNKNDEIMLATADSSVVRIGMVGLDARYQQKGFHARGELIYTAFSNTRQYNTFTGSDLGSAMFGYFVEAGYDLLAPVKDNELQLIVFGRYEKYDTQYRVTSEIQGNDQYNRIDITLGLHFKPSQNVSFKADYQSLLNKAKINKHQLNIGVGVWF